MDKDQESYRGHRQKIHHDRQMLGEEDKLAKGGWCSLFFVAMRRNEGGDDPVPFHVFHLLCECECTWEHLSKTFRLPLCVSDERDLALGTFLFASALPSHHALFASRAAGSNASPELSVTLRVASKEMAERERGRERIQREGRTLTKRGSGRWPWPWWPTTVRPFNDLFFASLLFPPIFYLAPSTAYDALLPSFPPCAPCHLPCFSPFFYSFGSVMLFIPLNIIWDALLMTHSCKTRPSPNVQGTLFYGWTLCPACLTEAQRKLG